MFRLFLLTSNQLQAICSANRLNTCMRPNVNNIVYWSCQLGGGVRLRCLVAVYGYWMIRWLGADKHLFGFCFFGKNRFDQIIYCYFRKISVDKVNVK